MKVEEVFTPLSDITSRAQRAEFKGLQEGGQKQDAVQTVPKTPKKQDEVRFKATHGILVAFFTLILFLHVFGIYLFTSGFLLTRLVLDHKSECAISPIAPARSYVAGNAHKGCWHPKTFNKAIIIIVDALRYDFTIPTEVQFEPIPQSAASAAVHTSRHFHDAIPFLYEMAKTQPHHAFLLPFIADPPTTTLQRLKGLTTGTLPTFIDAGSNFAGTAIEEDNLIAQLRGAGKRIVHLGDDTWHALFPGYFEPNLTHAYDSFNVWDLHTVDNGVTEHLFPLLQPEKSGSWDILIAHFLGVDHAGHRYGPDHPAMTAKLNQMNSIFERLIKDVDEETLVVVMGDHGMDQKGDHGGESEDEVEAALWMFSKKKSFGRASPEYTVPPSTAKSRPVAQIDLVPTLSLLLGMPIPFNNLGKPIEEAFIGTSGTDFENLSIINRLTAAQIHRYQHEYAIARGLDGNGSTTSLHLWDTANEAWNLPGASTARRDGHSRAVYNAFIAYQRETLRICRALWARFDIPRMVSGVFVLASTLVILGLYARAFTGDSSELAPVLLIQGAIGLVMGGLLGLGISMISTGVARDYSIILSSASGGILGLSTACLSLKQRLVSPFPVSIWGWISVIFTLALSLSFAANSFTIWEDEILLHFLTTFGLLAVVSSFRQTNLSDRTLGTYHSVLFTVLTRIASFSRLCREEQMPYCRSTYYASALSTTSAPWQLTVPVITALLVPTFIKGYFEGTRNYQSTAILWLGFVLRFGLLLCAAYWVLDTADDGAWYPDWESTLQLTKRLIAQIVLAISLAFGYSIYNWSKPLLNIIIQPTQDLEGEPKESITILGYANAHGSRYSLLITIWYLAVTLLQKPMGAGAMGILVWQLFSLFEIVDTNSLHSSPIGPIVLGLLGSFHYFKTGHQATLSSIQWESAFIPLATIRYPWSPMVVLLNHFGAQILCAIAVPALVLWKVRPQQKMLVGSLAKAISTHVLFYAVISLATTIWAGHLRRHLMLYRIFSPRFLLGAAVLLIVDVVSIFVGLWGARMSILSVAEVFGFGG